jgi:sec-independent protein translocase protein TatA
MAGEHLRHSRLGYPCHMPVLGFWDLLIIAVLVLVIFGPKRLPQIGRSLGGSMREFKDSITARHEREEAKELPEEVKELPPPAKTGPAEAPSELRDRDTVL